MIDWKEPGALAKALVELSANVKIAHWAGESVAVSFNVDSGNTFEIDQIALRLLNELKHHPLSVSEATSIYEPSDSDNFDPEQEWLFFQKYLNPLQQLDLIKITQTMQALDDT